MPLLPELVNTFVLAFYKDIAPDGLELIRLENLVEAPRISSHVVRHGSAAAVGVDKPAKIVPTSGREIGLVLHPIGFTGRRAPGDRHRTGWRNCKRRNSKWTQYIHRDRLRVREKRTAVIRHTHCDYIRAGGLRLRGRPRKHPARRINAGSGRRAGVEAEGKRLRGQIGIGCGGRKGN